MEMADIVYDMFTSGWSVSNKYRGESKHHVGMQSSNNNSISVCAFNHNATPMCAYISKSSCNILKHFVNP